MIYGALDDSGNRVGNPIKSSLIGEWAGLPNIERKCDADRECLRDPDRRKALAGRIRRVVADCIRRGDTSQAEIERRLSEAGISAVFRHNNDGRLTGATFVDHRGKNVYNGSALGKDLSANSWHALFSGGGQQAWPQEHERPIPTIAYARPSAGVAPERTTQSEQSGAMSSTHDTRTAFPPVTQADAQPTAPNPAIDREDYDGTAHDIFRGLSHQANTYEQIDAEFRTLYKRKNKSKHMKR